MLCRIAIARRRHVVTSLADTIFTGIIALGTGVLEENQPAVGIQLGAGRVVHVAADEPDVGDRAVARIHMATVAVGALDVLSLVVVGQLAVVAVRADIDPIGLPPPHVGTEEVPLG